MPLPAELHCQESNGVRPAGGGSTLRCEGGWNAQVSPLLTSTLSSFLFFVSQADTESCSASSEPWSDTLLPLLLGLGICKSDSSLSHELLGSIVAHSAMHSIIMQARRIDDGSWT